MRVDISPGATGYVAGHGGRLWVWAARPRLCCSGAPAWMHASTGQPADTAGFCAVYSAAGVIVYFRPLAGLRPDVLEIAISGRRHPKVAGYWDGCLMAMTA